MRCAVGKNGRADCLGLFECSSLDRGGLRLLNVDLVSSNLVSKCLVVFFCSSASFALVVSLSALLARKFHPGGLFLPETRLVRHRLHELSVLILVPLHGHVAPGLFFDKRQASF